MVAIGTLFASCAFGETSPSTGLPYPTERTGGYQPILVSMDNNYAAQVPNGLSIADVVYEYIYYGRDSTRFLALFNDAYPEAVGPVATTRYFGADVQQEWDAPFVYYGGLVTTAEGETVVDVQTYLEAMGVSESLRFEAKQDAGDLFWREVSMNPPRNVMVNLHALANDYWPVDGELDTPHDPSPPVWIWDKGSSQSTAEPITSISIEYEIHGYKLSYEYDAENQAYQRQHNGAPVIDPLTKEAVAASNVIVQYMEILYQDDKVSNPQITATGRGKADVFIHGSHISGYWVREGLEAKTRYYNEAGGELSFAPGQTFIQILPEDGKITY